MKVHRCIGLHDVILQQWFYRVNHCVPWWCHWVFQIRNLAFAEGCDGSWSYSKICRASEISSYFIHWQNIQWNQVDYTCLSADFASTQTGLLAVGSVGSGAQVRMPYFREQNTKSRMVCQVIRMIFSMFGWEKMKAHWFKVPFFPHWKTWSTELVSAFQGLGRHRWSRADHELGVQRFLQDRSDMWQPMR